MGKTLFSRFSKKMLAAALSMILVISSVSVAMFTVAAENVGVVVNGGFEDGVEGSYKTSKLTYEVVTDEVHSGSKAVKVQGQGTNGQHCNLYQKVAVKPYTNYTWKFWYKSQDGMFKPLVGVRDEAGDYLMPSTFATNGGDIDADRSSFATKRDTTSSNWHLGMTTTEWREYSVTFNTEDETAVWLTLNLWTQSRIGWTDDWSIEEYVPVEEEDVELVTNGGFENDTEGYSKSSNLVYSVVTDEVHSGSKAVKVQGPSWATNSNLYQKITVEPNKEYKWSFWYKAEQANNVLVGVRDEAGDYLMPSTITTDGDYIVTDNASFPEKRATDAKYWHQGLLSTEWQEYVITFNSGDETAVWLTLNMWYSTRIGWTDDWSVKLYVPEEEPEEEDVELVANGGFENDTEGYSKSSNLVYSVVTDVVHSGSKAVKLQGPSWPTNSNLYQKITVEPNKEYKWSFWYKAEQANNVLVGVRDEAGDYLMPSTITTDGDYIVTDNASFSEKRGTDAKYWHQGLLATEWQEYVITFNSGDETAVWLTLNMYYSTRSGWTDDWSVKLSVPKEPGEESEESLVTNGGFENDTEGYSKSSNLVYSVVTDVVHSGSKAVKLQGPSWATDSNLYQKITVEPNKEYKWSFWYKAEQANNVLVGVRDESGDYLMPSTITTDGDYIVTENASFSEKRGTDAKYWHQGLLATEWQEYVITFNSGDQTAVWLTLNMYYSTRSGWTDDWSVVKVAEKAGFEIINSSFEDDLNGYKMTDELTSEVVTDVVHSGEKAVKLGATGSELNKAHLYQPIAVKPDTYYTWKFWYKAKSGNNGNVLAGVRTEDKENLLSSTIVTDGGVIADGHTSYKKVRPQSEYANWHQGMTNTEWKEYAVTFYSADQTIVLLSLNVFYNNRIGWTDDWSIEEVDNNILTNPGFEAGADEYTAEGTTIAVDNSKPNSGDSALKITGQGKLTRKVKVNAHHNYIWKFYVTSDAPVGFAVATADGTTLIPTTIRTVIGEGAASPEAFENARADGYHLVSSAGKYTQYAIEFDTGINEEILLVYNADSNIVAYTDDWYLYGVIADAYEEIFNPGFEEECVDYYTSDTRLTFSVTEKYVHSGDRAMLIKNTPDGKGDFMQTVNVQKNSDYIWTFWLKFNNYATPIGAVAKDSSNATVFSEIGASEGALVQAAADWHRIRNTDNEWHQYKLMIHTGNTDVLKLTLHTYVESVELVTDDWKLEYVGPTEEKDDVLFNIDFENENMGCLQTDKGVWTVTDAESHSGDHSIKYNGKNDMNAYHMLYYNEHGVTPYFFKVEKNTTYRMSFWYKCTGNIKTAALKACVTDPKTIVDIFDMYGAENEEWNYYEAVLNTGDLTTLYFQIWPAVVGSSTFEIFVDDIKTEKVTVGINESGINPDEMECEDSENLIESSLRNTELTSTSKIIKKLELTPFGIYNFAVSAKAESANAQIGLSLDESGKPISNKVHGGSNAVKLQGEQVGQNCVLYQKVTVEPNKEYKWKFWYKAEQAKNVMVGVRDNAGDYLMPSTITTEGDYLSSATVSFTEKRTASSSLNWHQGLLATEWQEYVITFNSGDQTDVWLTLNMWSTDRIGWTDDWSVEEAATGLEIDVVNGGFENGLDGYKTSTLKYEVITAQTGILQFTDTNGEAEKKGFTFTAPEDGIVYLVMNNTSGTVEIEDLILYSLLPEPAKPKVVTPNQGSGNAGASIWDEDFDFDFDWNTDQEDSIFDVVDDNDDDFDFGFDNVGDNDDDSVQTSQGKKYRQIRKRVLVSKGQPGISTLAIILICVGAVLIVGAGTFVIILFARKKRR